MSLVYVSKFRSISHVENLCNTAQITTALYSTYFFQQIVKVDYPLWDGKISTSFWDE